VRGDIALFLGPVLVIGGVVAVVVFIVGNRGGSSICDRPVVPLGSSEISQLAFQAEDAGLTRVIEAASAGDAMAAKEAFSYADGGEVHNFTHYVDAPLREVDEELAKELCEAVTKIEEDFLFYRPADRVTIEATRIRELMRDAAEALGYTRPGG
jgi:hypothetical protein